jgi:hypothetical protein
MSVSSKTKRPGAAMTDPNTASATDEVASTSPAQTDSSQTAGTVERNAPAADAVPVGVDDRAAIAVFPDLEAAQQAISKLAAEDFPVERISIIAKDLQSEYRVSGFVITGDIAGRSAATAAWVGGLFGLLSGAALLFIPGAGPLIVLGPLATAAVGAAQGALLGGAVGAMLGHFVSKEHLTKYERLVQAGNYLVVVHGTDDEVERARRILLDSGSTDVERHDDYRGSIDQVGPIEEVFKGMRVVDAHGKEIGKVELVNMGDPNAVTIRGQEEAARPRVPQPFADRLLSVGYLKVDRTGLFAPRCLCCRHRDRSDRRRPDMRRQDCAECVRGHAAAGVGSACLTADGRTSQERVLRSSTPIPGSN